MNNTLKGVLFSALIFPGIGQIILAKYLRGAIFFAVAFCSGMLSVAAIVRQAVVLLQDVVASGNVVSIPEVMATVAQASTVASSIFLKVSFLIFFVCWVASVVDAWRIGKALDQVQDVPEE